DPLLHTISHSVFVPSRAASFTVDGGLSGSVDWFAPSTPTPPPTPVPTPTPTPVPAPPPAPTLSISCPSSVQNGQPISCSAQASSSIVSGYWTSNGSPYSDCNNLLSCS